ncbi:MAG: cyclic nucleotide-binding domain-containing protein [Chloroflexi bacterium]|nr:cyclic nucleotide-binding domain-containing protein [Chloroflexota bacterium]
MAVRAALAHAGREDADLVVEGLERRELRSLLPLWEPDAAAAGDGAAAVLARLAVDDPDELVRAAALYSIDGGVAMETLPMLSVMQRVLFLGTVPVFSALPPGDLKQVAALAAEETHPDGAVLGREGEVGDRLYVIAQGTVDVVGGDRVVARRGPGEAVGEMALLADQPRMATLRCAGEVRVLRLGRRDFEMIVRDRPAVALAVIRVLCGRLAETSPAQTR